MSKHVWVALMALLLPSQAFAASTTSFVGRPTTYAELRRCEVVQSLWSKRIYTRPKDDKALKMMAPKWALCSQSSTTATIPTSNKVGSTQSLNLNSFPELNIYSETNASPFSRVEYYYRALSYIARMSDAEWSGVFPGTPKLLGGTRAGHELALVDLKKKGLDIDGLEQQYKIYQYEDISPPILSVSDYIIEQDTQRKKIQDLINVANLESTPSDPNMLRLMNMNKAYLNTMLTQTSKRYATYLNGRIMQHEAEGTSIQYKISQAMQELQSSMPLIHAQALEDFDRISRIVDENYWKSSAHQTEKPYVCCKVCKTGKTCGDTCITRADTCHVGLGCACPN